MSAFVSFLSAARLGHLKPPTRTERPTVLSKKQLLLPASKKKGPLLESQIFHLCKAFCLPVPKLVEIPSIGSELFPNRSLPARPSFRFIFGLKGSPKLIDFSPTVRIWYDMKSDREKHWDINEAAAQVSASSSSCDMLGILDQPTVQSSGKKKKSSAGNDGIKNKLICKHVII